MTEQSQFWGRSGDHFWCARRAADCQRSGRHPGRTPLGECGEPNLRLARISHRLNPRLRGGAASPEAGRAEDYSGYENRGEDRKMRSEMPMDGLCLLEDDGVDTRCLSALRSSSSGGRIGQVAELG